MTQPITVDVYGTNPAGHVHVIDTSYPSDVRATAQFAEKAGFEGILVYSDNRQVDPFIAAYDAMSHTERISPMVALQPAYRHPYSVAKSIATITKMTGRRLDINLIAGGYVGDLERLGAMIDHDRRYERLQEYTTIMMSVLRSKEPYTLDGAFYSVDGISLQTSLPEHLLPRLFGSGSSAPGRAMAAEVGATPVTYPLPADEMERELLPNPCGIRMGFIPADTDAAAWEEARARFPKDRMGALEHAYARKKSDSTWHHSLAGQTDEDVYWVEPFKQGQTTAPFLVGSWERVTDRLADYIEAGVRVIITEQPAHDGDYPRVRAVVDQAITIAAGRAED